MVQVSMFRWKMIEQLFGVSKGLGYLMPSEASVGSGDQSIEELRRELAEAGKQQAARHDRPDRHAPVSSRPGKHHAVDEGRYIAIENTRLFEEVQSRTRELAKTVEGLEIATRVSPHVRRCRHDSIDRQQEVTPRLGHVRRPPYSGLGRAAARMMLCPIATIAVG